MKTTLTPVTSLTSPGDGSVRSEGKETIYDNYVYDITIEKTGPMDGPANGKDGRVAARTDIIV